MRHAQSGDSVVLVKVSVANEGARTYGFIGAPLQGEALSSVRVVEMRACACGVSQTSEKKAFILLLYVAVNYTRRVVSHGQGTGDDQGA